MTDALHFTLLKGLLVHPRMKQLRPAGCAGQRRGVRRCALLCVWDFSETRLCGCVKALPSLQLAARSYSENLHLLHPPRTSFTSYFILNITRVCSRLHKPSHSSMNLCSIFSISCSKWSRESLQGPSRRLHRNMRSDEPSDERSTAQLWPWGVSVADCGLKLCTAAWWRV